MKGVPGVGAVSVASGRMKRGRMILATTVAITVAAAADIPHVTISGATAIGVFPPFTQSELDRDDGSISEGTSHVAFALEDLAKCLEPMKLTTSLQLTRTLVLDDGPRVHTLHFADENGKSVGIVLVAPGRKPLIVYATAGPSSLQWLALDAAARYFSAPKCRRDFQ